MQGSPPDSVHLACSGLEMLFSTLASDDSSHICDRLLVMAANPLIGRWIVSCSLWIWFDYVWLIDYDSLKPRRPQLAFPSLGMGSGGTSCHVIVIGLAPWKLLCREAHALWRGHQRWDVVEEREAKMTGEQGGSLVVVDVLCPAASTPMGQEWVHWHCEFFFLNSWPAKSWAK